MALHLKTPSITDKWYPMPNNYKLFIHLNGPTLCLTEPFISRLIYIMEVPSVAICEFIHNIGPTKQILFTD